MFEECDACQGWSSSETGRYCLACDDTGQIWVEIDEDDYFKCSTCKGTGVVNPITAPKDFFCVSTTECPHCDGSGEI